MGITLSPDKILKAYRSGFFPMGEEDGSIEWYFPDPRGVIELERFHIPRRLKRTIRKGLFEIRIDKNFKGVLQGCADRQETWINASIFKVYSELHLMGKAHSIEAYFEGNLVGGIYGIHLGGAFMGESMFSRKTDASKVCLVYLVNHLREKSFSLLDIQFLNQHLASFGASEIPAFQYIKRLRIALCQPCFFK